MKVLQFGAQLLKSLFKRHVKQRGERPVSRRIPLTVEQLEDRVVPAATLIKDILAGAGESSPQFLTPYAGEVYFSADDGQNGRELWVTDGSAAGTHMVKDIQPGPGGSNPEYLFVAGAKLYFVADDGVKGRELWQTDGTNTSLVADINTTANGAGSAFTLGSSPWFTVAGGNLFYAANDGTTGIELWKTDLVSGATSRVLDIYNGEDSSDPAYLVSLGGVLYFAANNGQGVELWRSEGAAANTSMVLKINTTDSSQVSNLYVAGGKLYFSATSGTIFGRELFWSDGTLQGTEELADINSGSGNSDPGSFFLLGGNVFFAATSDSDGRELWRSELNQGNAILVKDINTTNSGLGSSLPFEFVSRGTAVFFSATDGTTGRELWKTDGTTNGTVRIADINNGAAGSFPSGFTVVGKNIYFRADDGTTGTELWMSNGTIGNATRVADINPGAGSSIPSTPINLNGMLIFAADDGTLGRELWRYDIPRPKVDGRIWNDSNNNGIQDTGEAALAGVTVHLLNSNMVPIAATTSDASGNYSFTDLSPGTYSVRFDAPSGYTFTAMDVGSDDSIDSDASPMMGQTMSFTVDLGSDADHVDAGLKQITVVTGRLWLDSNANGVQDPGESGLSGFVVYLLNSSGMQVASTTTGSNGTYSFTVDAGQYQIYCGPPNYFAFSPKDQGGNDTVDSDINANGYSDLFWIANGQTADVDAGIHPF